MTKYVFTTILCSLILPASASLVAAPAQAQPANKTPALIITNQPLPSALAGQVYTKPTQTASITAKDLLDSYYETTNTMVSRKIGEIHHDLGNLQADLAKLSDRMVELEKINQTTAADYFASVATIDTQLQSGSTPGNPRLLQRLATAQDSLEKLAGNVADINELAVEIANSASVASFLLEGTRSAYGLTGAVEEDHVQLAQLEDSVNNTIILIDRLQNNVNDDITRTSAYLTTERNNLRTLSLAIAQGDLLGKSLSNRPFTSVARQTETVQAAKAGDPAIAPSPSNPRPLVKIRFDKSSVDYEQPVYMAMNEAMEKFPDSRFELVAVHPTKGNAAQVSIESTKSRRNAERVLRTLTQMGLPMDRVDISYSGSDDIEGNEVHIYIR
ncbi:MAG: hypothetical protein KBC88_06310 [Alphaproteobacteria bacterium]|jgi:hypothetical protein|nr:hypothetical protein [Alphaproteobacteria bacterium]